MQFSSENSVSVSPSFTGHSSNNLADIAARVVEEFRSENGRDDGDDDIYTFVDGDNQVYDAAEEQISRSDGDYKGNLKVNEVKPDEEEFEFDVFRNCNLSPVSADEIFSNGEILPRYPLFDRSLLLDDVADKSDANSQPDVISPVVRNPLRKLFREERESATCSSSEADNLDGVTPGTYCIWKPKVESPEKCTKSNSTGNTSKRWRFRSLLQRSNSDSNMAAGKDASDDDFSPLTAMKKRSEKVKKAEKTAKVAGAEDDGELPPLVTNKINSANKSTKRGNRIRSYLWYEKAQ